MDLVSCRQSFVCLLLLQLTSAFGPGLHYCPLPPDVPNAHPVPDCHHKCQHDQGVEYECNTNYGTHTTRKIQCAYYSDEQWSIVRSGLPCETRCEAQSAPHNGFINETDYVLGDTLSVFCKEGYALVEEMKRICQNDHSWSGASPTCQVGPGLQYCPTPPDVPNAHPVPDCHHKCLHDQDVEYECNTNYGTHTTRKIKCAYYSDEQWPIVRSGLPCEIRCTLLEVNKPANGYIVNNSLTIVLQNEHITFACDKDFRLDATTPLICQLDGKWKGTIPTCQAVCIAPSPPQNGFIDKMDYIVGEPLLVLCNDDYALVKEMRRICQNDHSWSGVNPKCQAVCKAPSPPQNGFNKKDDYVVGERLLVSCNEGYVLAEEKGNVCQNDHSWSGASPTCQEVMCKRPKNPSNGNFNMNEQLKFRPEEIIELICKEGFHLDDTAATATCLPGGTWSQPLPTCIGNANVTPPPTPPLTTTCKMTGCDGKLTTDTHLTTIGDGTDVTPGESHTNVGLVVGASLGGVVVVGLFIAVCCLVYHRRNSQQNNHLEGVREGKTLQLQTRNNSVPDETPQNEETVSEGSKMVSEKPNDECDD